MPKGVLFGADGVTMANSRLDWRAAGTVCVVIPAIGGALTALLASLGSGGTAFAGLFGVVVGAGFAAARVVSLRTRNTGLAIVCGCIAALLTLALSFLIAFGAVVEEHGGL